MSAYTAIHQIDGFIDTLTGMLCGEPLRSLREVGVFPDIPPSPTGRTVAAAIRADGQHLGLAQWSLNALYAEGRSRLQTDPCDLGAASAMLLASPDFTTAWAVRKRQLPAGGAADELHFTWLVLTRSPKSAESWSHRAWVVRTCGLSPRQAEAELALAWVAATRAASNYYAGVHRLRVVTSARGECIREEVGRSRKWLRTHAADSSGWWYHRQLIELVSGATAETVDAELEFVRGLRDPGQARSQCIEVQERWLLKLQQAGGGSTA